jgi:hypothetical protein
MRLYPSCGNLISKSKWFLKMNNIIFEAGFDAYANGWEYSANPYEEGTHQFRRWVAGYNAACYELGEISAK